MGLEQVAGLRSVGFSRRPRQGQQFNDSFALDSECIVRRQENVGYAGRVQESGKLWDEVVHIVQDKQGRPVV
jgi:hypothetical protein